MISLSPVPNGLAEIKVVYGDPDANGDLTLDMDWAKANLTVVTLPYPMFVSWRPAQVVQRMQCHRLVADSLIDALRAILEVVGAIELHERRWDRTAGCFCFRQMRGYPALSVHSWGCAVDLNPDIGRFGNSEDARDYPREIVNAFESRGWWWGGRWTAPFTPDAMHFQACRGY